MENFLEKQLNYKGLKIHVKQREQDKMFCVHLTDFNNGTEYAGTRSFDFYVTLMRFIKLIDKVMITPAQTEAVRGDICGSDDGVKYHFVKVTDTECWVAKDCIITKLVKISQHSGDVTVVTDVKPGGDLHRFDHAGFVHIDAEMETGTVPGSPKPMMNQTLIWKLVAPKTDEEFAAMTLITSEGKIIENPTVQDLAESVKAVHP
jgi:hypothetical protein